MLADPDHDTGDFATGDVWGRRLVLILVLEHQRVGVDHRCRSHVDQQLIGPNRGIVNQLDNEILWWTERLAHDCPHAATLRSG